MGLWENGRHRKVKSYNKNGVYEYDVDIDKNGKGFSGNHNSKSVGKFRFLSPIHRSPFRFEEGIHYKNGEYIW